MCDEVNKNWLSSLDIIISKDRHEKRATERNIYNEFVSKLHKVVVCYCQNGTFLAVDRRPSSSNVNISV